MNETILIVDDEPANCNAIERLLLETELDLRILKAANADEALAVLKHEPVAMILSDNLMPGIKGVELLTMAKLLHGTTIRVLMTAYADLETALSAINHCEVFRFVVKPWNNEELLQIIRDGILRYQLLKSLQSSDEALFRSLVHTIELKDPCTRGHCDRVSELSEQLAIKLGADKNILPLIRRGALLHDCGKIGVPEETLHYDGPLHGKFLEDVRRHPLMGAEVARQASLPELLVNIILFHHEHYDGSGYPYGLSGNEIPWEARIVATADVYDALQTDRPYRKALSRKEALKTLAGMAGIELDPAIASAFQDL